MLNVKHIFKNVFLIILVIEFILMIITIIRYINKSSKIIEGIDEQRKKMHIQTKDLNFEYLNKKFQLIIEDEFLILRSLEIILQEEPNLTNIFLNNRNFPEPWNYTQGENYTETWYLKNSFDEIENERLRFFYYFNQENKTLLNYTLLIQPLLKKLLEKYFSWKNKIYISIEYIHITFNNGLFLKYPFFNDTNFGFCESRNNKNIDDKDYYNITNCDFFIKLKEEKIIFTKPYKFPNGFFGTDICIKSNKKFLNLLNENELYFVVCYTINFYDYSLFKRIKMETLNSETEYFITYINETLNNSKVVYNSNQYLPSLNCSIENDKENFNYYNCEELDFFNVFFKKELDNLYLKLSKNNSNNFTEAKIKYINQYENLKNSKIHNLLLKTFEYKILPHKQEILKLNSFNINSNQIFYCDFQEEIIIDSNNTFQFNSEGQSKQIIYFFPISIGFSYEEEIFEIENKKPKKNNFIDSYTLKIDPLVFDYYLIIRDKIPTEEKTKNNFMSFIVSEIILFSFYLLCYNFFVWFFFNFFYYYIIKRFIFPLKQILKLYLQIIEKSYILKNQKNTIQKNLNSDLKIKDFNNILNKKKENFMDYINNFCSDIIIKKITEISQIEHHIEIQKSLKTLKAITLILEFNNSKEKQNKKLNSTNITMFIEAIKFLSECFYSKYTDKERINYYLIKLMVENILMSMLQEFKNQKKKIDKNVKNKEQMNNLLKILNKIDSYHLISKKSISRARNELENVIKNSNQEDIVETSKNDLFLLSSLEENINYMYAIHKCMLFESFLIDQYDIKSNIGNNIDEEEKNIVNKLQKKEKKNKKVNLKIHDNHTNNEINHTNNEINNTNNEINNTNNNEINNTNNNEINNTNNNDNNDNEIINTNTNNNNNKNEKDILLEKKKRMKINFIKTDDDYLISEETKKYLESLISYCEDYLEIKIKNKKELKRIINKNAQTTIITSTHNIPSYFKLPFEEDFSKNLRSKKILEIFKEISILFFISKYYILIDEEQNGVSAYENALNKLKKFENKIEKIKIKLEEKNYKTTNFTMLFVNSIFYEKLIFIFSMLCNKFYQSKTEIFINLNLLDLSPIYSRSIRKMVLTKLLCYTINYRNELISRFNYSINLYKTLITDKEYINIQHSIYKLISIRNVTSQNIKKNILFLFDLGNKYIKDSVFKELLFNYFNKHLKENITNTFEYYFSAFDHKLYLQFEPSFEEEITLGRKYSRSYLKTIPKNPKLKLNENTLNNKNNNYNNSNNEERDSQILKLEKINEFFNFISEYNEEKKLEHRTDKAIYHSALFGMCDEKTILNNNDNYNLNYNRIKNNIKINEANYMIVMTNLTSTFNNNIQNWEEISKLMFDKKMTVIVLLSYDPNLEKEENLQKKISFYKQVLSSGIINGHLFIMRSLTILKFVLNTIFPTKYSEFNMDIIKHYLCSNENIYISKNIKEEK